MNTYQGGDENIVMAGHAHEGEVDDVVDVVVYAAEGGSEEEEEEAVSRMNDIHTHSGVVLVRVDPQELDEKHVAVVHNHELDEKHMLQVHTRERLEEEEEDVDVLRMKDIRRHPGVADVHTHERVGENHGQNVHANHDVNVVGVSCPSLRYCSNSYEHRPAQLNHDLHDLPKCLTLASSQ